MTTVVRFLQGFGPKMRKARVEAAESLKKETLQERKDAFSLVVSGPDPQSALATTIQAFGIGPIQANTVLANWIKEESSSREWRVLRYGEHLQTALAMGCHIVILHAPPEDWVDMSEQAPEERRIDVWWKGDANSYLMLLLAYLVTRNEKWNEAAIRVLAVNYDEASEDNLAQLKGLLEEARIQAEPEILVHADAEAVMKTSRDAALTFIPFSLKESEPMDLFGNPVKELLKGLKVAALIKAGREVTLDAEPEEGDAGAVAQALDSLEHANRRAAYAEKAAAEAAAHAAEKMKEIEMSGGRLDDTLAEKLKIALKARDEADAAARKALKEQFKSEEAAKAAIELGVQIDNGEN
jgi:hypothetical protein